MIACHETGATYRDPLPPLRQTAGQRPGRRCPYRVQMLALRGVYHPAGHAPRPCRPWSLSYGGTMATKRRPYHPPVLSDWLPPLAGPPGYIMGATGVQGFGTADYFVAQIPCATAREIIRREHYSHSVVNNSYVNLGVFLEGAIVGVLQWGYALNPAELAKWWQTLHKDNTWNSTVCGCRTMPRATVRAGRSATA